MGLAELLSPAGIGLDRVQAAAEAFRRDPLAPNLGSTRFAAAVQRLLLASGGVVGRADEVRVLNMACGRSPETAVLIGLLAETSASVAYAATDLRGTALDVARRRGEGIRRFFADFYGQDSVALSLRYSVGDLSDEEARRALPSEVDVVMIRHQNCGFSVPIWTGIFELALACLSETGCVIVTSHFDHEHALAINVMRALEAECVVSHQMPDPHVIGPDGKAVDRHLALFRPMAAR